MDEANLMEKIVSLCKRRGFVFPGSEIYGGLAGTYDYGPLGVALRDNLKDLWWRRFVTTRDDMVGLDSSIIAVVQPTEPSKQSSHVRDILKNRGGSAHWQHIALRTPDLLAFHKHALERGVNFITPILKDADEDLIQVFSGEWNLPGARPTGIFFEFVQRDPGKILLKKLAESNRESWFRDKTFMGLYGEKEDEYRRGKVRPFIDEALFKKISALLKGKRQWEITEKDLAEVEETMKDYAEKSLTARA